ncbi:hypothetical protein EV182_000747 [Spiromyces aspiralis]|uniref:Uncharacterized protein n=1 Tax=Spiromyces aspiralis TaxID=68401 RepID=A0ACC1HI47_9FUNG|nr:hypothetical protein EV182_000747 [Spiromyces aspiralis]
MFRSVLARTRTLIKTPTQVRLVSSVNQVTLVGNVGADPEVKELSNGASVANINLATHARYKDGEGNLLQRTSWHRVRAFGNIGKTMAGLVNRGDLIYVSGELQYDNFKNKDNVDVTVAAIRCNEFKLLNKKSWRTQQNDQNQDQEPESEQQDQETPTSN